MDAPLLSLFQNMLNITLFYFFIFSLYYFGRKYVPKIQFFLKAFSRWMKDYPIIMMTFTMGIFWVMQSQQGFFTSKSMANVLLESKVMPYHALENLMDASEIEILFLKVITLLFTI